MEKRPDFLRLDHSRLADVIKSLIKKIRSDGKTYSDIENDIAKYIASTKEMQGLNLVNADSLKVFYNRTGDHHHGPRNATLKTLYYYFFDQHHKFPIEISSEITANINVFRGIHTSFSFDNQEQISSSIATSGHIIGNWFNTSRDDITKAEAKYCGKYYLFRKSVKDPSCVVRSEIEITSDQRRRTLFAVHRHWDRHQAPRISNGFLLPAEPNMHLILNIENGAGVEFISIRNPIQFKISKLYGFINIINMYRNIFSARIFFDKNLKYWEKYGNRFFVDDISEPRTRNLVKILLDDDTCLTIPDEIPAEQ